MTIRLMKEIDEVIEQHGGWLGDEVAKPNKNLNCTVDPRGQGVTPPCGACKG